MPLIRVEHRKNYTVINNHICNDPNLSWKAKGIFLYAFSRMDDWEFNTEDLVNRATDGKDSVSAGLRELEKAGYLRRSRIRNEDGTFARKGIWTFYETPEDLKESLPQPENPDQEIPDQAKPPQLSTDSKTSTDKKQQQGNAAAVVLFDCLINLEIPEPDKTWLCKNHSEAEVKHAVEWATHPMTKIETTLQQAIKWACKAKPKIPVLPIDQEEANRTWALAIEKHLIIPLYTHFTILSKSMEISYDTNKMPDVLEFKAKGFKEQAASMLMKAGFKFNKDV
jgi:hypothetical protein